MAGRPGRSGGHNKRSPEHHLLHGTWNVTRHGPRPGQRSRRSASRRSDSRLRGCMRTPQAEWRRLAPVLGPLGSLTETDADALAAYCEAFVTWKQATQKLRQFGLAPQAERPRHRGHLALREDRAPALAHMRAFLVEFGMTPSAGAAARRPPASAPPKPIEMGGRALTVLAVENSTRTKVDSPTPTMVALEAPSV